MILGYHFDPEGFRPYWHPLRLPGSPVLTMNQPADHVHHQGMWVAWKSVNGVNFWEQPQPGNDPTGFGRILHRRFVESHVMDTYARFISQNSWIDWQGKEHLLEERTAEIGAPAETHWGIGVRLKFIAHERDVTLDLKRGKPGGGGLYYSGLTIRFDNSMTPGVLRDSEGRRDAESIFGQRARWCSFTARHPENAQMYGIAIIDDSDNPTGPTPWWVRNARNYGILHPSPCYYEPISIRQGESVELRYRVLLYRGDGPPLDQLG